MTTTGTETEQLIADIRRRVDAATKGPWKHDPASAWRPFGSELAHEYVWADTEGDDFPVVAMTGAKGEHPRSARDAEFIAHARTDIPQLLDLLASALETIEILSDPDVMADIAESEADIAAGRLVAASKVHTFTVPTGGNPATSVASGAVHSVTITDPAALTGIPIKTE